MHKLIQYWFYSNNNYVYNYETSFVKICCAQVTPRFVDQNLEKALAHGLSYGEVFDLDFSFKDLQNVNIH